MAIKEDLDASWAEWLKDKNPQGKITQGGVWRRDNPSEWMVLKAYRNGGTRPNLSSVTGKKMVFETDAWVKTLAPVPPPPSGLGSALMKPLPRPSGAPLSVYTWSQLTTALADPNIRRIQIADTISNNGDFYVTRRSVDATPLWIQGGKTTGIRWLLTNCANVILDGIEIVGGWDGVKIESGAHRVELTNLNVHESQNIGLNQQANATQLLIHRNKVWRVGLTIPVSPIQHHGCYIADANGFAIYNNEFYDNQAFGIQIYPDCRNGQITCNEIHGGVARTGIVEDSPGPHIIVGNIIYDAMDQGEPSYHNYSGREVFDTLVSNAPSVYGGNFTRLKYGALTDARNFVDPSRSQYVPPTWMDGTARVGLHSGAIAR